jgi:hypothetical protein
MLLIYESILRKDSLLNQFVRKYISNTTKIFLDKAWCVRYYIGVGQYPHYSKRPERLESIARFKQG